VRRLGVFVVLLVVFAIGQPAVAQTSTTAEPPVQAVTGRLLERLRHPAQPDPRIGSLTSREREILDLIADGLSNKQIGERLFLAEKTVKNYVSSLLAKLGMERRTEAAAYAARLAERRRHTTD